MKTWLRHLPLPLALVILLVAGAAVYFHWPNWVAVVAFIVSALLLLVGLLAEIEGLGDWVRRRGVQFGASLLASVFLVAIMVVAVNWLANRRFHRWDLTRTRMFELSDQTRNLLRQLDRPVRVIGFFTGDNTVDQNKFDDLMKEFRAYTDKLQVERYDPLRYPTLARQYQVTSSSMVILAVKTDDKEQFEKVTDITESGITSGLIRLMYPQKATICYLTGHGEVPLAEFGTNQTLRAFKQAAEREQYTFEEVRLFSKGKKETCTVLLIVRPQYDPVQGEKEALTEYLKEGGRIGFLADTEVAPGWRDWLQEHGVKLQNDVVYDEAQALVGGDPSVVQVNTRSRTPLSPQGSIPGFVAYAQSVEATSAPEEGRTYENVLESSSMSWADRDRNGRFETEKGDKRGPVTMGVIVRFETKKAQQEDKKEETSKEDVEQGDKKQEAGAQKGAVKTAGESPPAEALFKKEGRLFVVGDADWLTDAFIGLMGNAAIGLNALAWLAQREVLISEKKPEAPPVELTLTRSQLRVFRALTLYSLPLAMVALAIFVWWRRRRL